METLAILFLLNLPLIIVLILKDVDGSNWISFK